MTYRLTALARGTEHTLENIVSDTYLFGGAAVDEDERPGVLSSFPIR